MMGGSGIGAQTEEEGGRVKKGPRQSSTSGLRPVAQQPQGRGQERSRGEMGRAEGMLRRTWADAGPREMEGTSPVGLCGGRPWGEN